MILLFQKVIAEVASILELTTVDPLRVLEWQVAAQASRWESGSRLDAFQHQADGGQAASLPRHLFGVVLVPWFVVWITGFIIPELASSA